MSEKKTYEKPEMENLGTMIEFTKYNQIGGDSCQQATFRHRRH